MGVIFHQAQMTQLLPLTGPPNWLLYGWYALGFLFLPTVGALLPVLVHRPSHRAKAATVVGAVAITAAVLWYELFMQTIESQESFWLIAAFLGMYVSAAISLVHLGSERNDDRFSIAGGSLGALLVVAILVM